MIAIINRLNILKMPNRTSSSSNSPKRRSQPYRFVPFDTKEQLIEMVFQEGSSIYMAAKVLKVKYSTAKFIAKQYQTSGIVTDHRNRTTALQRHKASSSTPEQSFSSSESIKEKSQHEVHRCQEPSKTIQPIIPEPIVREVMHFPMNWGPLLPSSYFSIPQMPYPNAFYPY